MFKFSKIIPFRQTVVKPSSLLTMPRNFYAISKPYLGRTLKSVYPKFSRAFSSLGHGLPAANTIPANQTTCKSPTNHPTLTYDQTAPEIYTVLKFIGCMILGFCTAQVWLPAVMMLFAAYIIVIFYIIGITMDIWCLLSSLFTK
jgi:hypothetical protein